MPIRPPIRGAARLAGSFALAGLVTLVGCSNSAPPRPAPAPGTAPAGGTAPAPTTPDVPQHAPPAYRLELEPPTTRDTVIWRTSDLATRRFDAVEIEPLSIAIDRERIAELGLTAEHAEEVIRRVGAEWDEWRTALPPLTPTAGEGAEEIEPRRPLRIVTRFTDRNTVPRLSTTGSAIDATGDRLARVCLLVEFHDPAMRERVGAYLTQRDANHIEEILRGNYDAALTRRVLRPRLRALADAVIPPEAVSPNAVPSTPKRSDP